MKPMLNTAHRYLRTIYSSPVLQYPPAQLTVSLACVQYLTSSLDLVDPQIPSEETRSQVLQCFHDLQLYANDNWLDHLSALANTPTHSIRESSMLSLRHGLERLTKRHNELATIISSSAQDDDTSVSSAIKEGWPSLGFSTSTQSLLNRVLGYKSAEGDHSVDDSCTCAAVLIQRTFGNTDDALCSRIRPARRPNAVFTYSGPFSKHTGRAVRRQQS